MHVLATAGHVDHGKSTLVRALTGMEPDRWAEERRRGMTIDLGFAWTDLDSPDGKVPIAFVDVPGHERLVPNMLAGVGPVPAVLFVVAADEGWMPQSQEHLDALNALGVRHGLLAVTRSDLADSGPTAQAALARIRASSLGAVPVVPVSAATGAGLDQLRAALVTMTAALPPADVDAPVRLWVDRSFTIRGSGTVVTGTLPAGTLRIGQELLLEPAQRPVRVRGLQSLGNPHDAVAAVARVAVNLRGVDRSDVARGDALVTPGRWWRTTLVDVRLHRAGDDRLPAEPVLHVGAASAAARVRPLGSDTARLSLGAALPLRIGDRGLLRDPGHHRVVAGLTVLDVAPPSLRRRGAAAARAGELAASDGRPDGAAELRRRRIVRVEQLLAMGAQPPRPPLVGDWLVEPGHAAALTRELEALVRRHLEANPLDAGLPVESARARLGLPDSRLVSALARPPVEAVGSRLRLAGAGPGLPEAVERAVQELALDFAAAPFAAPDAARLAQLGLGPRQLAAALRVGRLVAVAEGVVLGPGAPEQAAALLAQLPAPFTVSQARQALGTSRRVAVPLLEQLDRRGLTRREPDDRRRVLASSRPRPRGGS